MVRAPAPPPRVSDAAEVRILISGLELVISAELRLVGVGGKGWG